jgi:two-component system phosphate regulon sensor histidine kinase PhoR
VNVTAPAAADADAASVAALLEALNDPAALIDAATRVVAANAAWRALLPAARLGQPLALALRAPDVLDAIARVQQGGGAETVAWSERRPFIHDHEVHAAPIRLRADGRAVLLTLRDLTEIRRTERLRVDFIANASHELRTPLTTLLGFVETLQGAARDDSHARERFLNIMAEQARRMKRLIDDLLSLSRIEQNERLIPQTAVDLADIARQVVDGLAGLAGENHIRLGLDAPDALIVTGDRDELVRAVENLVENAIKYSADDAGAERSVEISLANESHRAVLHVRDNGPGIAPAHLPRLTERFYRVDAGQSRAKGGTGLGLALVKHIVARHRGRLSVDSRVGEGSTFTLTLPMRENAE